MALAELRGVPAHRDAMFRGDIVNATEGRKVLHVALRARGGSREADQAAEQMARARALADELRRQPTVRTVVNIGIGGSDLGPAMAYRALRSHRDGPECRFVSNIDPADLDEAISGLDPAETVFVVSSKTFTTQETMHNAARAREWVRAAVGGSWGSHFVAATANPAQAVEWGVAPDRVLEFWDWVGGRFSVSSVIGFPVMVAIGPDRFAEMLDGMRTMDEHFASAPLGANLPVVHALVAYANAVVFGRHTTAVVPYSNDLARFPAFLQQLVMESNGKSVTDGGNDVMWPTSPIVWGDAGTNGQHAFFQLLHQGTRIVPVEFIGVRAPMGSDTDAHDMLVANMLAQAAALALGRPVADEPHRVFPGNRPSTTIFLDELSPRALGELIALHEHSTAVQGWLFGVNSFDQWGVELGKELANDLLPEVRGGPAGPGTKSTRDAINWYRNP
ncbi:MAG: glucose-6-phosphate isomerase [Actinobacteria bacterium]|nr:glucose-6-phosphate isomerase [Actinomycetota bacterium]